MEEPRPEMIAHWLRANPDRVFEEIQWCPGDVAHPCHVTWRYRGRTLVRDTVNGGGIFLGVVADRAEVGDERTKRVGRMGWVLKLQNLFDNDLPRWRWTAKFGTRPSLDACEIAVDGLLVGLGYKLEDLPR